MADALMGPPTNTRVWVAAGVTDMRCGFDGLAAKVRTVLAGYPFSRHVFLFCGRRGHLLKALWWSNGGLSLLAKRLEQGRFVWPQAQDGVVSLTAAQLGLLLEGFDLRAPRQAGRRQSAL